MADTLTATTYNILIINNNDKVSLTFNIQLHAYECYCTLRLSSERYNYHTLKHNFLILLIRKMKVSFHMVAC